MAEKHDERFLRLIGAQAALSAFAEYIVELPELGDFSRVYRAAMSEYAADGSVASPVSQSFFFYTMCCDFEFGPNRETISSLFESTYALLGLTAELSSEVRELSASRCAVFENCGWHEDRMQIRDLVSGRFYETSVYSGYRGGKGEVIFSRLCHLDGTEQYVEMLTTPYVTDAKALPVWQTFLLEHQITKGSDGEAIRAFFRVGPTALKPPRFYWLSYVRAAYQRQTHSEIYLRGAPTAMDAAQNCSNPKEAACCASISGTFLRFIDPLLSELGYPDPRGPEFDAVAKVGWTVWNAVVKNDVDGDPSFFLLLKASVPPPYSAMTDVLVERKRRLFAQDKFLIGHYEVRKKADGSFSLYADARETSALRVQ